MTAGGPPARLRVGVLASGEGTNLQALLDGVHGVEADVVALASDRADAPALARAAAFAVPSRVFPKDDFADRAARDAAISAWLAERDVQLVVLAGYMALLSPGFTTAWAGRLVNVHPSLLPAFPGIRAIEQALDYGVKVFGVTVHLVDDGVDTGQILGQCAVDLPSARRVEEVHTVLRPLEHALLCEAVRRFARGEVRPDPGHPRRMLVGDGPLIGPG
ncbi:phosphoribosylglycinamide formyltransferase [Paraconexibacter antarcticus]|uniref:Phosphoribosylglycinamide formyltransferase n=1 Tax=Paraconexibacter antarcticus TaxID=2949664 RepID=A0ABY5DT33_9ACTN|nr:phosphoribosylglycinamide formyltransferase [Paraconexibacter antarcticus]UTI64841.1 phosphoribosylglycinamide formyltransferase [Paraconexibacter antarcticus]